MIGRTLGHYEVHALIGRGGMGEVYRARDTRLDRDVALKVLPADMASDPARLERFMREAKTVAALNHPHIVHIYSVEEDHGVRFLTMELVEGQGLDGIVPSDGLSLAKVFDIGIAVADALAAAHEKGIVHRDLKPANVLIAKDGRAKVLDFGLAKLAERTNSDVSTTRTTPITSEGTVMGTVPYMSPEQLRGQDVDHRSDIFSFGILLYEMATGRRPFSGATNADISSSILSKSPAPVTQIKPDMPHHMGRIVSHCLEKDPDQRIQSAKDIRNELRALRKEVESGVSEAHSTESLGTRVSKPAGRKPMWIAVAMAVVVVAAVAFMLTRGDNKTVSTGVEATGTNSLAVLPFADMSAEKDQEYFSDGLTEELLNALVKIPDLKVAGRTSSFAFKGTNEDLRSVGEKLGVAHILEGSVRKSGDRVRITAQLVKAADGFHLWSQTYDRTLDDIFAVQNDIAQSVAHELKVTLLGASAGAASPNAAAYDLILQARYLLQGRTAESTRRAQVLLEEALRVAPDYAPTWAEIGLSHMREYEMARGSNEAREALAKTRTALSKALEIDPELAIAHSRMASVHAASWEFAAAEKSTEKALAADPKNSNVLGNASLIYGTLGKVGKSMSIAEELHASDRMNVVAANNLAGSYMALGRFDEAEALCRSGLRIRPDSPFFFAVMGDIALMRGNAEEAQTSYAKFQSLIGGTDYERLIYDALVEHTAGNESVSKECVEEFETKFGEDDAFTCGGLNAWIGNHDKAFEWMDRAVERRDPSVARIWEDIFIVSTLGKDPRWKPLLKRIGLPTERDV